jgi:hypothetical protein
MYFDGQIVWDHDAQRPVRVGTPEGDGPSGSTYAYGNLPRASAPFMHLVGWVQSDGHALAYAAQIYLPPTIADALEKLEQRAICPMPVGPTPFDPAAKRYTMPSSTTVEKLYREIAALRDTFRTTTTMHQGGHHAPDQP